jgi:hypothetical protein
VRALVGEGAVSQGLAEQAGIAEGDPDALLQVVETAGGNLLLQGGTAATSAGWASRYEPDFSCMYSQACPTVVIFSASSSGISSPVFSSNA